MSDAAAGDPTKRSGSTAVAAAAQPGERARRAPARAPWDGSFAIKVDVDTEIGLRDGTPRLLELFARRGVRATWFVAMGPDRTGRSVLRVFRQRGFLAKMIRSRAPRLYPLRTMLRGTLLPAVQIAASHPNRLREIAAAGHEIAIHGWDHVRWHDELAQLPDAEVAGEIARAADLFEEILGRRPEAFAAPGWQCTGASLRAVDALGFRYRSDTRGASPYRPEADGYRSLLPEIPTTLPTLDELLGNAGHAVSEIADRYERLVLPDRLNLHTVHTEIEGGPCGAHLEALLERVAGRVEMRTVGEIASLLPPVDELPVSAVAPGRLPGRGGTVACQVLA